MEQRNKPEMDVEAMLLEQALRERVDAAFERLRNGTAVYLSHSEVEKRMALFKAKIRGGLSRMMLSCASSQLGLQCIEPLLVGFERGADL
ncbi:hypothetical protein IHE77_02270 [Serratia ureilytica]|uniref:hypothetical protein n=1 Tax=Serratia ureilytica TaxID=300181 RepID=UPI00191D51DB|nr:hypothetical protein [Serratia ureilytica]QQU65777.1 hypothetical protein I6I46_00895 [Serratia ureilytica]UNE44383.1 hypothetical protein IHE77_02270 [Serratia ureilytica]